MKTNLARSGPWIGMSGMAAAFFLYAWSAIVLPSPLTLVLLPLVWVALTVLGVRWFLTRPYRVLALPFVATAAWFAALLW